jgi:hypothetical protein
MEIIQTGSPQRPPGVGPDPILGRSGLRTLSINPQACELVHSHLRSSGTEYGWRRDQAMIQQAAKRIPLWLTIDSLVIVVGLAIIGIGIWIAPF